MTTLREIKKQRNLTNKAIGTALGTSASVVGMILQGRHINVYSDEDIQRLADILGVTFERCWYAMCESCNEWAGTPGKEYQRMSEVRADVQENMGFPVDEPRPFTVIESCNPLLLI